MPTCGTAFFSLFSLFIVGLIIGILIILCLLLKGFTFKRKHGFSEPAPLNVKDMNPAEGSAVYNERKDTVDGSGALKDFKRE